MEDSIHWREHTNAVMGEHEVKLKSTVTVGLVLVSTPHLVEKLVLLSCVIVASRADKMWRANGSRWLQSVVRRWSAVIHRILDFTLQPDADKLNRPQMHI